MYVYALEGISFIGVISRQGSHEAQQPPEFERLIPVHIASREVARIQDIPAGTFNNAYPCIGTADDLVADLGRKYPGKSIRGDSKVTVCQVEYLDSPMLVDYRIPLFLERGIIPVNNPGIEHWI